MAAGQLVYRRARGQERHCRPEGRAAPARRSRLQAPARRHPRGAFAHHVRFGPRHRRAHRDVPRQVPGGRLPVRGRAVRLYTGPEALPCRLAGRRLRTAQKNASDGAARRIWQACSNGASRRCVLFRVRRVRDPRKRQPVERTLRFDPAGIYPGMDEHTRYFYRHEIAVSPEKTARPPTARP